MTISFETAGLAKELGYNRSAIICVEPDQVESAPTQEQLHKWLREEHNLYISVGFDAIAEEWYFNVFTMQGTIVSTYMGDGFDSWEFAMEGALQEVLESLIQ